MRVREATVDDATEIARVHVASWQSSYRGIIPQAALNSLSIETRSQRWAQLVLAGKSKTFVLEDNGKIVGFINCGPARDEDQDPITVGEIPALYLFDSRQGKGFGRLLFEKACEHLIANNHVSLALWVLQGNSKAIGFYEAMGLTADGTIKNTDKGDYQMTELRFKRVL